uniref:senescence associated gene 20-like n=1 Tax=Erigeron canadensis TaxID=72917 RepID=UPI001CB9A626|nr:senescence associated gene 20-like [Erigeron canadensis]
MEEHNKNIVYDLYKALATGDTTTVQRVLAPDIEWWFHGPPSNKCNLMRVLTSKGYSSCHSISFEPLSIVGIGTMVLAEGYQVHQNRKTYWVHAWTVDNGKIITEVKEYHNSSVIVVTRIKKSINDVVDLASPGCLKPSKMWQSKLANNAYLPRLLLVL